MSNGDLLRELTTARSKRGVLGAIRALRRRGLSLPLSILWALRFGRR
jgi:hypothetical protein